MTNGADDVELTEDGGGVQFLVKVVPGSSRNKVAGVWDTALRVAVAAPPEGGKANRQLVRVLAEVFGVKPGDVAITRGRWQPLKRVRIASVSVAQARRSLVTVLAGGD